MAIMARKPATRTAWFAIRKRTKRMTTRDKIMKGMRARGPMAGMALAGAAAAFLLDPANGKGRRTRLLGMTTGRARRTAKRVGRLSRGVGARAHGVRQKLSHLKQEPKEFDDSTLAQKVRSEILGRPRMHAERVIVEAHHGTVVLRGQVEHPQDMKRLSKAVSKLPGVATVESYLHLPATRAPNKQEVNR